MTKHHKRFEASPLTTSTYLMLLGMITSLAVCAASSASASELENSCATATQSEIDAVFNQAVSTVSNLSNAAVKAKARGAWRPTGSFRKVFFGRSGRALGTIKTLLTGREQQVVNCATDKVASCTSNSLAKTALLQAFDQIFEIPFPQGLRSLRRLKQPERVKFMNSLAALPDTYTTCG